MKHKIIQDFHYLSNDKKITILKTGTIIENYIYTYKGIDIKIDKEIVNVNKEFFTELYWRTELLIYIKKEKIAQPAIISKKLYPFIEDMFISSKSENREEVLSNERLLELEQKEFDLERREKRIVSQEDDLSIRLKRIEKRELEYKDDILNLEKKEEVLKEKILNFSNKEYDLISKLQEVNEKERNIDAKVLEAASNLDQTYKELQTKIDSDIKNINEREKELDIKSKGLSGLDINLQEQLDEINNKREKLEETLEEFTIWESELNKLNGEIQDWENLHWKFQRTVIPPSAIK